MKKQITIREIEVVKEGVSKRGPWTLYRVTDTEGKKYSAFSNVLNAVEAGMGDTIIAEISSTKTKTDKGEFVNLTIESASKAPNKPENKVVDGDMAKVLKFLETLCRFHGVPEESIKAIKNGKSKGEPEGVDNL